MTLVKPKIRWKIKYSIVKIFILNKRLQFELKIFGGKIKSSHFYDQFRQINREVVNHSTNHLLSQKIFSFYEIGTSFIVIMEEDRKYNGQITHRKPKYCTKYEQRQCLTNTNHGGNPDSE